MWIKCLSKRKSEVALAGSLGRAWDPRPPVVSSSSTSATERTEKINKRTKGIRKPFLLQNRNAYYSETLDVLKTVNKHMLS